MRIEASPQRVYGLKKNASTKIAVRQSLDTVCVYRSKAAFLRPLKSTFDVWFDAGCAWLAGRRFISRWISHTAQAARGQPRADTHESPARLAPLAKQQRDSELVGRGTAAFPLAGAERRSTCSGARAEELHRLAAAQNDECNERLADSSEYTEGLDSPGCLPLLYRGGNSHRVRREVGEGEGRSDELPQHQASQILGTGREEPVDVRTIVIEGSDQHRGWFQALLFTHAAMQAHALEDQGQQESRGHSVEQVGVDGSVSAGKAQGSPGVEGLAKQQKQEGEVTREKTRSELATEACEGLLGGCSPQSKIPASGSHPPGYRLDYGVLSTGTVPATTEQGRLRARLSDAGDLASADEWSCLRNVEGGFGDRPFDIAVTHGFVLDQHVSRLPVFRTCG